MPNFCTQAGFRATFFRSFLFPHFAFGCLAAALFTQGCVTEGNTSNSGILYDRPVAGAREFYIGFRYGGPKAPSPEKTYTQDSLVLEVLAVEPGTVHFSEKWCMEWDSLCHVRQVRLDRASGHFSGEDLDGSIFHTANLFPSGLFTEDSTRRLVLQGYAPVDSSPAVGFVPEFHAGKKVYRDVTFFVDPTGVLNDVGGNCLVLTKDKRLVESYRYHVFGTDGGWEAR
ncbi:MAG: hypothetical protein ABIW76_07485 [Fibrobacteria bacterium]